MIFSNSTTRDIQKLCEAIDSLNICKGDIINCSCDAIVCPDNVKLSGTGGLANKIHQEAGPLLKKAVAEVGACPVGQVRVTDGFQLNAKYIIHTASPTWEDGMNFEEIKLANCYASAIRTAFDMHCESVAMPSIGTGYHRFPKKRAAEIAVSTILYHMATEQTPIKVTMICANQETYEICKKTLKQIIVKLFADYFSPESCACNNLRDSDMGPYYFWMVKLRDLETIPHEYSDYIDANGFKMNSSKEYSTDQYYYLLSQKANSWDYRTCLAYIIYLQRKSHWDGYASYHAAQCKTGGVRNVLLRMYELLCEQ